MLRRSGWGALPIALPPPISEASLPRFSSTAHKSLSLRPLRVKLSPSIYSLTITMTKSSLSHEKVIDPSPAGAFVYDKDLDKVERQFGKQHIQM